MSPALRHLVVTVMLGGACGCAFFGKSNPEMLRYFTPETSALLPPPAGPALPMQPGLDLRMGRINSASYVKDRIAFRDQPFELGYYEDLRWTEKPEAYLRRALTRALFEEHGMRQIVSGPGTTLDVDLDAFEELRSPRHVARMQVTWTLHDDERVQTQETFTVERPISSTDPGPAIAAAMAAALDESVRHVVSRVVIALSQHAAGASPPPPLSSR